MHPDIGKTTAPERTSQSVSMRPGCPSGTATRARIARIAGRSHGSTGMIPGTEAESVREPTTGRLRQARHYCAAAAGRLPGCCLGERLFGMQKDSRSCDNDRDFRDGPTKELSA